MIGATLDYGTAGCDPIQYRITYDQTYGYVVWPHGPVDTSTTQGASSLSSSTVWVSNTGPSRSRASRDVEVELPEFPRPVRPIGPRTRVRWLTPILLAPKGAARATAVAWTRGRVPRGASDRVLRCWGIARRR